MISMELIWSVDSLIVIPHELFYMKTLVFLKFDHRISSKLVSNESKFREVSLLINDFEVIVASVLNSD